jgi:transcription elongation factor SPT6
VQQFTNLSTYLISRHLHESQNIGNAAGGKTPFGAGGRTPARTPARTPGHATPGHVSVRALGRTPNPYGAPQPSTLPVANYGAGGPLPGYNAPQTPYGYQTPSGYPSRPPNFPQQPPAVPAGMNPARAAMIQNSGGWGQDSASWG